MTVLKCSESGGFADTMCSVEMQLLKQSPFHLSQGDKIVIAVRARNEVGWGLWSAQSTLNALFVDVPHKPLLAPMRDDLLTSDLLMQVYW